MKRLLLFFLLSHQLSGVFCQNMTDASLFMRADSATYLEEVSSESGNLYQTVGHHGPAVENEWMGLRIYFDHKCAIDVYSKTRPGLELKAARWYPSPALQLEGWGADYYKVGSTVGLGGVKIWDGEQAVALDPVSQRKARVYRTDSSAVMEMISEGVPLHDKTVDILTRVTVITGDRFAKVETEVLSAEPVQLATGINYHDGMAVVKQKSGIIAAWGLHPEDVAAELVEIGSAILYQPDDYTHTLDDGKQVLLISKPTRALTTHVISVNEKMPKMNSLESLLEFLAE